VGQGHCERLLHDGVDVVADLYELPHGANIHAFMERCVRPQCALAGDVCLPKLSMPQWAEPAERTKYAHGNRNRPLAPRSSASLLSIGILIRRQAKSEGKDLAGFGVLSANASVFAFNRIVAAPYLTAYWGSVLPRQRFACVGMRLHRKRLRKSANLVPLSEQRLNFWIFAYQVYASGAAPPGPGNILSSSSKILGVIESSKRTCELILGSWASDWCRSAFN
jgi:hypothetical protein